MAWSIQENSVFQGIEVTSTTQLHPFGTIVRAKDPTWGAGEFIYLKGVSGTVVGSWVTYSSENGTTALLVADAVGPVAIAMAIHSATTQFGWYQISGNAFALGASDSVGDSAQMYADSVAGKADDSITLGSKIYNARSCVASDSDLTDIRVSIQRPWMGGDSH